MVYELDPRDVQITMTKGTYQWESDSMTMTHWPSGIVLKGFGSPVSLMEETLFKELKKRVKEFYAGEVLKESTGVS